MFRLKFSSSTRNILLPTFKYRDRTSIILDILDTVRHKLKGETKTNIMRNANLNFDQANTYLVFLIARGLIKAGDPMRSQELARYKLTKKGLEFARSSETIRFILR